MENKTSVFDCSIIELGKINSKAGNLTVVENNLHLPFSVNRVYYLYDIPGGEARGAHAHKKLQQFIVAASGSFDISLDDGQYKRTIHLARANIGVYIPAGLWRELHNFSSGAICLVLASQIYTESDYIRNYDGYLEFTRIKDVTL